MAHERTALRLYRAHRDTLVNYANRLSGDRAQAEDIVQDAWLLMDRKADTTVIHEPLGYLRRIIRNLVFARARRHDREVVVAADGLAGIADDTPSAEAGVMARQMMETLLDTIDAMPEHQKAAVKMHCFEDLKLREIAGRLGLSVSHTHRLVVQGMEVCNRRRREGL